MHEIAYMALSFIQINPNRDVYFMHVKNMLLRPGASLFSIAYRRVYVQLIIFENTPRVVSSLSVVSLLIKMNEK
jgi:hypothetical protein